MDLSISAGSGQPVPCCVPSGNVAFPASQKVHSCAGGRLHSPALFAETSEEAQKDSAVTLPIGSSELVAALGAVSASCSLGQIPPCSSW